MFEQSWQYLIDNLTKAVKVIPVDNSLTHDGKGFSHHEYHTGLLTGTSNSILFITPPDKDIHFRSWSVSADQGITLINVYEDTVVSANGTQITSIGNTNRQRNTANKMLLYSNPTVTSVGNLMLSDFINTAGSGAHTTVGAAASDEQEWILKKNAKYMFRITNNSGSTANFVHTFHWYEL